MFDSMTPIHTLELLLLALMFAVAAISGVARRFSMSYPIVLVMVGLLSSLLPHLPHIPLPPDVVFLVFLPPLLFSAAWQTSWRDFKNNIFSICLLAFGLVGFTAVGVAYAVHFFLPGFDWRMGFLLGAVVSTTDAVAAGSIAKKVGMPQRIVDILEGESLINDATGLLALEFGVDMIVHGTTPTFKAGLLRLDWLVIGGIGVGVGVGAALSWLEKWIDDAPVEIAVSIVTPYACYLLGESVHASGVIAVVACGLLMSRQSARFFSANTRLAAWGVWEALEFLLNGLVFILLGLQFRSVVDGLSGYRWSQLIAFGFLFSLVLIVLRMVWVYPGAYLGAKFRHVFQHQPYQVPNSRSIFVVGWTGMRGVIALAAAYSLPERLANGQPFEQRNLIIFLTYAVILVTLVFQGLSLPALVRWLKLDRGNEAVCEEGEARRILLRSAISHLQGARPKDPANDHMYEDLLHSYTHQMESLTDCGPAGPTAQSNPMVELLQEVTRVEREELIHLRDEGRISDQVQRKLQRELDLNQTRLTSLGGGEDFG